MPDSLDFASLFDAAPNAYMVLDAEFRFVAANAAYLDATATAREQLIGQRLFDLFPNDPNDPANVSAQLLRRSLERVLATGQRDHLAYIPYRVPKKVGDQVVVEERYWSATHCPIHNASGRVAFILQHTVDVTELHAREHGELGEQARTEAGVLSRARAVQEENARIDFERERLAALFAQAPGFMAVLDGRDHVFRLANDAYLHLVGNRDVVGKRVGDALPEVVEQGFVRILDRVYESGEPFIGRGVPVMLERHSDAPAEQVFLDFIYQPVRGPDGRPMGIFVQGHDVTLHKKAEQEREAARRAAEAFSDELKEQSREVLSALEKANKRIAELEAELAKR